MKVFKIDEMCINEGAGAGYVVKLKDIELDLDSISIVDRHLTKDKYGREKYDFSISIKPCDCEWSASSYYDTCDSGQYAEHVDELCRHIDGGSIGGCLYADDIAERFGIEVGDITEQVCIDFAKSVFNDNDCSVSVEAMYGGGWVHVNLGDSFELGTTDCSKADGIEMSVEPYSSEPYLYSGILISYARIESETVGRSIDSFFDDPQSLYELCR